MRRSERLHVVSFVLSLFRWAAESKSSDRMPKSASLFAPTPQLPETLATEVVCRLQNHVDDKCSPIVLSRATLSNVTADTLCAISRHDSVPYKLFLTTAGGRERALLVNERGVLFQVPAVAPRRLFLGSLFTGELFDAATVSGDRAHVFIVYDVHSLRGERLPRSLELRERTRIISDHFFAALPHGPSEAATVARSGRVVCGGSKCGLSFRCLTVTPLREMRQSLGEGVADECSLVLLSRQRFVHWRRRHYLLVLVERSTLRLTNEPLASLSLRVDSRLSLARFADGVVLEFEMNLDQQGDPILSFDGERPDRKAPDDVERFRETLCALRQSASLKDVIQASESEAAPPIGF